MERNKSESGLSELHKGLLDDLKRSIKTYDRDLAARTVDKIIENKIDPLVAMDAMTETIRVIGEGFEKGEFFLPDLVGGADAMTAALPALDAEIKKGGSEIKSFGSVVIGTVLGDIHSIGKTMVATLLTAAGFSVHDIGIDVHAEEFISAIKKFSADILAMSALLTTTAPEMEKVISQLKKEGLRDTIKIIIGGGAITQQFSDNIGADGYNPTAPGAVKLAKKLLGK